MMDKPAETEGIDWRPVSAAAFATLALALVVSAIPRQPTYFGFLPWLTAISIAGFAVYSLLSLACRLAGRVVAAYTPTTSIGAKRANEQIKLVANTVNAVALATAAAFGITQFARDDQPDYVIMILFVMVAFDFHRHARNMLSLIKDENPTPAVD